MSSLAPFDSAAGHTGGHDDSLVVAYTAAWCGHCRAMLPDLRRTAERPGFPRLEVVDVSSSPEAASAQRVTGTPTIIGYRRGVEVGRLVGRKGVTEIEGFFEAVASGASHRRSLTDPIVRGSGALVVGALGLALDAIPLMVFAVVVLLATAVGEWSARHA